MFFMSGCRARTPRDRKPLLTLCSRASVVHAPLNLSSKWNRQAKASFMSSGKALKRNLDTKQTCAITPLMAECV